MTAEFKSKAWEFITHQSPRTLIALSGLGMMFWFARIDKLDWVLMVGTCFVTLSFQVFNYLIMKSKK